MNNTTTPTAGGTPLLVHGTLTAYHRHKCRCASCTAKATEYSATRSRLKAYGRWQPRTDAEQVRNHLRALQLVPLPRREIALRSGLNPQRIKQILDSQARSIRTSDARAILNIPIPATPVPSTLDVDATATRRRLQALIAAGYPLPTIMRTTELSGLRSMWDVVHARQAVVTARTELAVSRAYDLLWTTDPREHGVLARHSARARALGRHHRWAPAMAWDDDSISDPAALPNWTGRCGSSGGYYDHTQIGTPTCQPCRDAVARDAAERKARRRARQDAA